MPETVWKYPLDNPSGTVHQIPQVFKILSVGMDADGIHPAVWIQVDPHYLKVTETFTFAGTGHPLDQKQGPGDYIGTASGTTPSGSFVAWHVYWNSHA